MFQSANPCRQRGHYYAIAVLAIQLGNVAQAQSITLTDPPAGAKIADAISMHFGGWASAPGVNVVVEIEGHDGRNAVWGPLGGVWTSTGDGMTDEDGNQWFAWEAFGDLLVEHAFAIEAPNAATGQRGDGFYVRARVDGSDQVSNTNAVEVQCGRNDQQCCFTDDPNGCDTGYTCEDSSIVCIPSASGNTASGPSESTPSSGGGSTPSSAGGSTPSSAGATPPPPAANVCVRAHADTCYDLDGNIAILSPCADACGSSVDNASAQAKALFSEAATECYDTTINCCWIVVDQDFDYCGY
jgi:hypothetical protein